MTVISVDNDFARFGGKSYAINKINTVEVREEQPNNRVGAVICGVISVLSLVSWLGSLVGQSGATGTTLVLGLVFGGLAYWLWQKSKIREYHLFLMTSSSETQAFVSRNFAEVYDLREQIETAMLHHSRSGSYA